MNDECDCLAECLLKEITEVRAALYREPVYPTAAEEHDRLVNTIARFFRQEFFAEPSGESGARAFARRRRSTS
jgi:hypothetical protein